MTAWHRDAFSVFPVGQGWDIQVEEFDFRDNGGTVYEKNGVKVIHWQRSHAKDGASAYRLDWQISDDESLCFVWTGDGRPSELDIEYAAGCDVYVTELQQEVVEIQLRLFRACHPSLPGTRSTLTTRPAYAVRATWRARSSRACS